MAAPSIRATGTPVTGSGASITPTIPGATVDGDLMILAAGMKENAGAGMAAPAGWTAFPTFPFTSGVNPEPRVLLAWRIKQAGDANPAITNVNQMAAAAVIVDVMGDFDPAAPIVSNAQVLSASGTTVTSNNLTPLRDGTLAFFAAWASNAGLTSGITYSGWSGSNPTLTEIVDVAVVGGSGGGNMSLGIASGPSTGTAALGARTATLSAARVNVGALFGVNPLFVQPIKMVI